MRILQIVETLERGGLERVVVDLCAGLAARGHSVKVICLFRGGGLVKELEALQIPVVILGKRAGLDVKCLLTLRRHLKDSPVDVVHTHNATCGYYAAIAGIAATKAVWINSRHGMGEARRRSKKELLYRCSLFRYDSVVTVCGAARSAFVSAGQIPGALARVIPNGIQLHRFSVADTDTRSRQRRALGIADGTILVGSVGRLNWAKDFPMLVRAFGRARHQARSDAQLVIVGEGSGRGAIESVIRASELGDAVTLLGDRSDVAELLQAMDVFACSSKTEGYSIALLEACASGLPIVATNVGGNSEIVQHGVTGLMASHNTEEEMAEALAQLLGNAPMRREFAIAARAWSIKHASLEAMVDAYLSAYGR